MDIQHKWVWITGASSGLGEALAYAFADAGANLILSSRTKEALERVKANCNPKATVLVQPLDVAQHEQLPSIAATVLQQTGRIDMLINNAGVSQRSLVKDTDLEVDKYIMNVDFFGSVALTKAVLPFMLKQGSGHIVAMSSLVGKIGSPMRSAYAASKHALHGFFDSLRAETMKEGIKVTLICPGYIHTNVSVNALTADGTPQNKMDKNQANGMPSEVFARKALRGILREREEVYIGGKELAAIYLKRFFPGILSKIISGIKVN